MQTIQLIWVATKQNDVSPRFLWTWHFQSLQLVWRGFELFSSVSPLSALTLPEPTRLTFRCFRLTSKTTVAIRISVDIRISDARPEMMGNTLRGKNIWLIIYTGCCKIQVTGATGHRCYGELYSIINTSLTPSLLQLKFTFICQPFSVKLLFGLCRTLSKIL